ncbi:MAG TPA: hypothetical protein VKG87_06905, partial [Terriglobales bacterium]|nr:hypothetical protein [Terriglobales bacterium]
KPRLPTHVDFTRSLGCNPPQVKFESCLRFSAECGNPKLANPSTLATGQATQTWGTLTRGDQHRICRMQPDLNLTIKTL